MKRVYAGLPTVKVEPLLFAPGDISGERLLSMMRVEESARTFSSNSRFMSRISCLTEMPLYMESVMTILRSMQDNFDYAAFRRALNGQGFNFNQMAMLKLRLALLDSCLEGGDENNSASSHFKKGQLIIIE